MDIVVHPRPKGEDGSAQITELLDIIKGSADSPVLGALLKVRSLTLTHLPNCAGALKWIQQLPAAQKGIFFRYLLHCQVVLAAERNVVVRAPAQVQPEP